MDAAGLARVRAAAPNAALLPLIETAAGVDRVREIAAAPGVQRLVFGSIERATVMRWGMVRTAKG